MSPLWQVQLWSVSYPRGLTPVGGTSLRCAANFGSCKAGSFSEVVRIQRRFPQQLWSSARSDICQWRYSLSVEDKHMQEVLHNTLGEPLDIRTVAKLIGCSVWTVRQRHIPAGLPHFRSGPNGKLIFYSRRVVEWLLEKEKGGRNV
jgi:hypothetical protein